MSSESKKPAAVPGTPNGRTFTEFERLEMQTVAQWDKVCSTAMDDAIVGKTGYKKVIHGRYEVLNIEFFTRERVNYAKKITQRIIRTYRAALLASLGEDLEKLSLQLGEHKKHVEGIKWYQWKKARAAHVKANMLLAQLDAIEAAIRSVRSVSPEILNEKTKMPPRTEPKPAIQEELKEILGDTMKQELVKTQEKLHEELSK